MKPLPLLFAIALSLGSLRAQEAPPPAETALPPEDRSSLAPRSDWKREALLLYNEAYTELQQLEAVGAGDRRLRAYASALMLLHSDSGGPESLEKARSRLESLVAAEPDDDVGVAAQYYLNRLLHRRLDPPQTEAARAGYLALFRAYPNRFFGQLALHKYALLELYRDDEPKEGPAERVRALEALGERLAIPDIRRNFHRSLAEAHYHFNFSEREALEHLKEAYEVGFGRSPSGADAMVRLAETAERLGQLQFALSVCEDFLETFPNDPRADSVRERASSLERRLSKG